MLILRLKYILSLRFSHLASLGCRPILEALLHHAAFKYTKRKQDILFEITHSSNPSSPLSFSSTLARATICPTPLSRAIRQKSSAVALIGPWAAMQTTLSPLAPPGRETQLALM